MVCDGFDNIERKMFGKYLNRTMRKKTKPKLKILSFTLRFTSTSRNIS